MKKVWSVILATAVVAIGCISWMVYFDKIMSFSWWVKGTGLLLTTVIITSPALKFWCKYFNKLLNK